MKSKKKNTIRENIQSGFGNTIGQKLGLFAVVVVIVILLYIYNTFFMNKAQEKFLQDGQATESASGPKVGQKKPGAK
jgi:hypothetical protein